MKVSVIVPVYNSEKYLKRCLDSIILQTYENLEIIIVNDGSTDGSANIIKEYKRRDSRIKEICQINQGCVVSRVNGIKEATGEYCMFVDSDDWIEKITIEKLVKKIEDTDADIVKFRFIYEPSKKVQNSMYQYNNISIEGEAKKKLYNLLLTTSNLNNLANQIVKRKLFNIDNDNFKMNIRQGEDLLVNLDLFYRAKKILLTDETYYHYFKNECSITNKIEVEDILKSIEDILYVYSIERMYCKKFEIDIKTERQVKIFMFNAISSFIIKLLHGKDLKKQDMVKLQRQLNEKKFYDLISGIEKKDVKDKNPIKKAIKLNLFNKKVEKNYKYRYIIILYTKIRNN